MVVEVIPQKYKHRCDACGNAFVSESPSLLSGWSLLTLKHDRAAIKTIDRLLCNTCTTQVYRYVNDELGKGLQCRVEG